MVSWKIIEPGGRQAAVKDNARITQLSFCQANARLPERRRPCMRVPCVRERLCVASCDICALCMSVKTWHTYSMGPLSACVCCKQQYTPTSSRSRDVTLLVGSRQTVGNVTKCNTILQNEIFLGPFLMVLVRLPRSLS